MILLDVFSLYSKGENMVKIYEAKLPNRRILQVVNGEKKVIIIPCNDICSIYEQSGQLYYCINNATRLIPIAS